MTDRNESVWTTSYDPQLEMYIPVRQSRRITRADNSYTDRNKCQDACDKKNMKYERPIPLKLSDDLPKKTKLI